jgi:quercetin dioxygenase-like cupin family protein
MEPGARLPGHHHRTAEQFYMLEGDAYVTGQVLHPGDYYRAPAGTTHDVTYTQAGCLFLLVSSNIEVSA